MREELCKNVWLKKMTVLYFQGPKNIKKTIHWDFGRRKEDDMVSTILFPFYTETRFFAGVRYVYMRYCMTQNLLKPHNKWGEALISWSRLSPCNCHLFAEWYLLPTSYSNDNKYCYGTKRIFSMSNIMYTGRKKMGWIFRYTAFLLTFYVLWVLNFTSAHPWP